MNTTIITRGYEITIPTGCVAAFLTLSHDDQVALADELLYAVEEPVDEEGSTEDVINAMIEDMAVELTHQDQAIDAFMAEREELNSELSYRQAVAASVREERNNVIDAVNTLAAENRILASNNDSLNDILIQSSRYVGQVRELLGQLGITIETDSGSGHPVLVITA